MNREAIACPCCGKTLYTLPEVPETEGLFPDGPHLRRDGQVAFMTCPHCDNKIIFQENHDNKNGKFYSPRTA